MLKFRVCMPKYYHQCSWNGFVCWEPSLSVYADGEELSSGEYWYVLYNECYINRGAWVYVPNLDRQYDLMEVDVEYDQWVSTEAGELNYEIPWFTYDVTNYCQPTYWINAGHATVLDCLQEALSVYGSNPSLAPGAWGDVEAISIWMRNEMIFTPNEEGERFASDVLSSRVGDCMDMAVAFCALCRRDEIPARPCGGMALTVPNTAGPEYQFEDDGLHVFAEFWDGTAGCWVALDPYFGTEFTTISRIWHAAADDLYNGVLFHLDPDCGAEKDRPSKCSSEQLSHSGSLWDMEPREAPGGDILALVVGAPPYQPPGMMPPNDGSGYGSVEKVASGGVRDGLNRPGFSGASVT